ncbi:hypothetical protein ABIB25_000721 [Nakamurella sp. UYEF19]|uniref:DUF4190 domain-containing protein n=1 Tax=Nakamurella sp. UYEF19 TaxID=1756392 RepID=UPI0033949FCA
MTTPDKRYPTGGDQTGAQPTGAYPPGAFPTGAFPAEGYPTEGYPTEAPAYPQVTGYPPPGYPQPAPGQLGYPQGPYGQPAYGQPGYGGYPAPRNGLGTAALVLGIIGVVLSWTVYAGFVLGVLAICFGGVGLGRAKRGEATNRGSAMAGLVLGIIAVALLVVLIVIGVGLYASGSSFN